MVVFLKLNIYRKVRITVISFSHWSVYVVSNFWVIWGNVTEADEVLDFWGLHKITNCVFPLKSSKYSSTCSKCLFSEHSEFMHSTVVNRWKTVGVLFPKIYPRYTQDFFMEIVFIFKYFYFQCNWKKTLRNKASSIISFLLFA